MIVVIEGVSASGRSTWCGRHGAGHVIPEMGRLVPSQAFISPAASAEFWANQGGARWISALAMERANGLAICDTDPLKLHYAWSLWQIGEGSEERWACERTATRQAMLDRRLGFADTYIIGEVDQETARRQRDGDTTRQRKNFELHLRLQPPLLAWYGVLASVLACPFSFAFPDHPPVESASSGEARYDVGLFDRAMELLPRPRDGG